MLNKIKGPKKNNEIRLERPVPDFVPYACHWDEDTILTKNGELLQTIKIVGFSNESVGSEEMDLRHEMRMAIAKNLPNDNFALWLHTVRKLSNLEPGGKFPEGFSKSLNESWKKKHHWDKVYINEVYITILYEGKDADIWKPADFMSSLYFGVLKFAHKKYLEKSHARLKVVVDKMLVSLSNFGAFRLTVREKNETCYSEQMQFFYKILNMEEVPVPMPLDDISACIADHGIAIGFNTMEVRGETGKKFGAIFTIREYQEIPAHSMDAFLQLPQEFIVTQTLDLLNSKKAVAEFKRQKYIYDVSGDQELSDALGLGDMLKDSKSRANSFGNSQITILLINKDLKALGEDIKRATDALGRLGMVTTRHDLRMEECFWSQLPGNFSFISRKRPINTYLIGGLASLFNFPAGKKNDNYWGPAVTMFRTAKDTPYFFSFHKENNGHTAVLGPNKSGKTVLVNFLVGESQKFGCKVFFFDQMKESKVFIKALGGSYVTIEPEKEKPGYAFNPFRLENNEVNLNFLKEWVVLLARSGGVEVDDNERGHLESLVEVMMARPENERSLSALKDSFGPTDSGSLGERMSKWYGDGKYAHIFDNQEESVNFSDGRIYGFDMTDVVKDGETLGPVLLYLFHVIEMSLDGKPAIIVLDEAWNLVNNKIFAPKMEDWLDRMREKNVVVIFSTKTVPNSSENEVTLAVTRHISTQIFLPNPDADESRRAYKNVWGLSEDEFYELSHMRSEKRQFMLRQEGESIVASIDLRGLEELYVLSSDGKTVTIAEGVISEKGDDPEDWLPAFYERVKVV